MFFKMNINFEFAIDKYPRILLNSDWNTFQYKDWPKLSTQSPFKEYVRVLYDILCLLDAGNENDVHGRAMQLV